MTERALAFCAGDLFSVNGMFVQWGYRRGLREVPLSSLVSALWWWLRTNTPSERWPEVAEMLGGEAEPGNRGAEMPEGMVQRPDGSWELAGPEPASQVSSKLTRDKMAELAELRAAMTAGPPEL